MINQLQQPMINQLQQPIINQLQLPIINQLQQPMINQLQQPAVILNLQRPRHIYNNLASKQLLVISILVLLLGITALTSNAIAYTSIPTNFSLLIIGYGLWCGVFFIISGGLGIGAARVRSKCLIVGCMVMAIISSLSACVIIGCGSASVEMYNNYKYNYYYYLNSHGNESTTSDSILIATGVLAFILSIWQSALCCAASCCCTNVQQQQTPMAFFGFSNNGMANNVVAGLPNLGIVNNIADMANIPNMDNVNAAMQVPPIPGPRRGVHVRQPQMIQEQPEEQQQEQLEQQQQQMQRQLLLLQEQQQQQLQIQQQMLLLQQQQQRNNQQQINFDNNAGLPIDGLPNIQALPNQQQANADANAEKCAFWACLICGFVTRCMQSAGVN